MWSNPVLEELLGGKSEYEPEEPDPEEYEPDEPDPEEKYAPDVPSVSIPDTSDADVPQELFTAFWGIVVSVNVGLFAASLGLMLVYFRGQWRLGGGVFALGVVTLAYGYLKYRRYQQHND